MHRHSPSHWCQIRRGRPLDHFAQRIEAGAVARAVPSVLDSVPRDNTPQVRANSRVAVQDTVFIAIRTDLLESLPHDSSRSGGDVPRRTHLAGSKPVEVLNGDIQVFTREVAQAACPLARRIIDLRP